jgi:formylglycine-generating enzyme required for sulfatase activity
MNINYKLIPAGEFLMGTPESQPEYCADEYLHEVKLTSPFYIQTTPVTVSQWRKFIEETNYKTDAEDYGAYHYIGAGSLSDNLKTQGFSRAETGWQIDKKINWKNPGFSQTDDHPVTCISYNDTQSFISWLNSKENAVHRLPTEAEWEYACRSGSMSAYYFGNSAEQLSKYAWFVNNSEKKNHPVKSLSPNAWGLYDMHGNVWEICQDKCIFDSEKQVVITNTYRDNISDPLCQVGELRVLRGGGCRSGYRYRGSPKRTSTALGFRLVKEYIARGKN